MNAYSRLRSFPTFKIRSEDTSDPASPLSQTNETPDAATSVDGQNGPTIRKIPPKLKKGTSFKARLSRNYSCITHRFLGSNKKEPGSTTSLKTVLRRAFSMRRTSTGADGYSRIHDTGNDNGFEVLEHGGQERDQAGVSGKKKGKIIRACKRLLGL